MILCPRLKVAGNVGPLMENSVPVIVIEESGTFAEPVLDRITGIVEVAPTAT
jgi:hypothetical protein